MKYEWLCGFNVKAKSPPSRGAWIEILRYAYHYRHYPVSPPSRGAWIEIHDQHRLCPA